MSGLMSTLLYDKRAWGERLTDRILLYETNTYNIHVYGILFRIFLLESKNVNFVYSKLSFNMCVCMYVVYVCMQVSAYA